MAKIGRNDPCPCGSRKKYKHCCLALTHSPMPVRREEHLAVETALNWLAKRFGGHVYEVVAADFFGATENGLREKMAHIPDSFQTMAEINANEWLIADATLTLDGQKIRTADLLLGPGGPKLTPQGRKHIEALAAAPLSLYEIQEVQRGTGVLVADLIDKDVPPFFVHEVSATESLIQWDIIGARCMLQNGTYSFGGGVYPLQRKEASRCLARIQKALKSKRGKASPRAVRTEGIITWWVNAISTPPQFPIVLDQQTKELIAYTTDNYAVSDWQALEAVLLAQKDVEVEEDGAVWTHAEAIDAHRYRSLARLERIAGKDRLRVECNTRGKADAARKWLEAIAGDLVRRTSRKSVTPSQALRAAGKKKPVAPSRQEPIPQEAQRQIIHEFLTRHYEEWPSIPLPALKGKTPLEAAKLKSLRPKLMDILKQIEQGEARRAKRDDGVQTFDVSFLWERLGIERR